MTEDQQLERAVSERLALEEGLIASLQKAKGGFSESELKRLAQLRDLAAAGIEQVRKRRPKTAHEVELLARSFSEHGCMALFNAGAQRGGDFLLNNLRGRWAEEVVLSMQIDGLVLKPFGPTGAAMPGEEDYKRIRTTYSIINRLEGKRPDLIGFARSDYDSLSAEQRNLIGEWPNRPMTPSDIEILRRARVGIEVKNSAWLYGARRSAGGDALSITVKQEEIAIISEWSATYHVPVVFVQVLFDEAYAMSFKRMCEFIQSASNKKTRPYSDGDYSRDVQTGEKDYHHLYTGLKDQSFRCADVVFPFDSKGIVGQLPDGSVIPYIKFSPSRAENVRSNVLWREIEY